MNWDTKNYLRDNAENSKDLDNARWKFSSSGVVLEPVSGALERIRRSQYLHFFYEDTSGLGPVENIFFFSQIYKYMFLVLSDNEVWGMVRARGSFSSWEMRCTQCVSKHNIEVIEFFFEKKGVVILLKLPSS